MSLVDDMNQAAEGEIVEQPIKQRNGRITKKNKQFIKEYLDPDNKDKSLSEIVQAAGYNVSTKQSGSQIGGELLKKPEIMAILANHADQAVTNLDEIERFSRDAGKTFSREGASYMKIAADINESRLDRVIGKAKQVTEVQSTGVTLVIDLTTALQSE